MLLYICSMLSMPLRLQQCDINQRFFKRQAPDVNHTLQANLQVERIKISTFLHACTPTGDNM